MVNTQNVTNNNAPAVVNGKGVYTLESLEAAGIPKEFILTQLKLGAKLEQVFQTWEAAKAFQNPAPVVSAPKAAPAANHITKAASDATKKTIHVPAVPSTPKKYASLEEELAALKAENERLKKGKSASKISMKVSEKLALSVYGLGRFPVTLYREQWERLLAEADAIKAFIAENDDVLATKES